MGSGARPHPARAGVSRTPTCRTPARPAGARVPAGPAASRQRARASVRPPPPFPLPPPAPPPAPPPLLRCAHPCPCSSGAPTRPSAPRTRPPGHTWTPPAWRGGAPSPPAATRNGECTESGPRRRGERASGLRRRPWRRADWRALGTAWAEWSASPGRPAGPGGVARCARHGAALGRTQARRPAGPATPARPRIHPHLFALQVGVSAPPPVPPLHVANRGQRRRRSAPGAVRLPLGPLHLAPAAGGIPARPQRAVSCGLGGRVVERAPARLRRRRRCCPIRPFRPPANPPPWPRTMPGRPCGWRWPSWPRRPAMVARVAQRWTRLPTSRHATRERWRAAPRRTLSWRGGPRAMRAMW